MSGEELQDLREFLDKNLARGFIRPAKSPMGAPVIFVGKKDGTRRLCQDYRGLNAIAAGNAYPLPLIPDLLDQLGTGTIFTKLDLREAYYRVRVREGDEWKTAFNCQFGQFEFLVMPFGLSGAPGVFMSLINEVLHDLLYKGVVVYLDDVLVYSQDPREHVRLVREVLQRLLDNHLYVKLPKCEFHRPSLDYLGYRISAAGVAMDPQKVEAVLGWERPRTRRQLQSLLGFANFCRGFLPNYSALVTPLTDLLGTKGKGKGAKRPGAALEWGSRAEEAFQGLKRAFAAEPTLIHVDPARPMVVQVDASDVAMGAVLLQRDGEGRLRPGAYLSRKFGKAERNWSTWEKEAAAIRMALEEWRHWLEGARQPFEVWTDHRNLEALRQPRKLTAKHMRWAEFFSRYDFQLSHIPGKDNFLADALSRLPQYEADVRTEMRPLFEDKHLARAVTTRNQARRKEGQTGGQDGTPPRERSQPSAALRDRLVAAYPTDTELQSLRDSLTLEGDIWRRGSAAYVPEPLRRAALEACHDAKAAGHFGFVKTWKLVRRSFWWPTLRKDVKDYVAGCPICLTCKPAVGKPQGLLQPLEVPPRPWSVISMDFITDLPPSRGKTAIWVVVDLFSKQAHFVPCASLPTATQVAKLFMEHIFRLHGVPDKVISDRGSQFVSRFWKAFLGLLGIEQGLSSAYHPQTDGQTERVNQVLEQYLRCFGCYQQDDWSQLLPLAEFAYNNSVHSSTEMSPFAVVYGIDLRHLPDLGEPTAREPEELGKWRERTARCWESLREQLLEVKAAQKRTADQRRRPAGDIKAGCRVYLSTRHLKLGLPSKKLGPRYLGPFKVIEIINGVSAKLELPKNLQQIHPVFHFSLLKKSPEDDGWHPVAAPPTPLILAGGEHHEVKDILDSRFHRGRLQYLVEWKDFATGDREWVWASDVLAPQLVKRFHQQWPNRPGGPGTQDAPQGRGVSVSGGQDVATRLDSGVAPCGRQEGEPCSRPEKGTTAEPGTQGLNRAQPGPTSPRHAPRGKQPQDGR